MLWKHVIACCSVLLEHVAVVGAQVLPKLQIVPGATWTATNTGKHIQAHGAGMIKVDNKFYMIGEDKSLGSSFQNVNCYSSTDLVEWTYVGALLSRGSSGDLGPNRVVERPKVIFNKSTGKYVLYMHIDSGKYGEAKVGVATGDSVCGKYTYHRSFQPMGKQSRDMGLWVDDDGAAYLLSEDRANGLRIFRLSADYLSVASSVYLWSEKIEAPAMLKRGKTYYMFGSHLSGWSPNDNVYSTASSISGPWSPWKNFAPAGSKTFKSQTTFILPLSNSLVVYGGDRWTEKNLARSTYVWLPLKIDGTRVSMENAEFWDVSVSQGRGQRSQAEKPYSGNLALLSNKAKLLSNGAAGYIGGPSNGSARFSGIQSDRNQRKTMKIYYMNGDKDPRYASITTNNGAPRKVAFLATDGGKGISVVDVDLRAGSNEIIVTGLDGGWGPDIDSLKVAVGS